MKRQPLALALALAATMPSAALALDSSLPPYQKVAGISGQLKSIGSDTLGNEMQAWSKGFTALYPDVKFDIEAKGSGTAPPALIEGASQLAPMSRTMTTDEGTAFQKKYGYRAISVPVSMDTLAVYVNKDNPVKCLALTQVDQIFSATRQGSGGKAITNWGEAGLTGDWASKPMVLFGRNRISGTYEFFRTAVMYSGEYRDEVKLEPGSEAVVADVAADKSGIGYSGIGYKADGVRAVPLAVYEGRTCYEASAENAYNGQYPLTRFLYLYLNKDPKQPLDALRTEFLKYVLSRDGQELAEKNGFYSVTNAVREEGLKALGITPASN